MIRFALLLAAAPVPPAAQQASLPDTMIHEILRDRVSSKRAVGLVVATYAAGTAPRIFAHGSSGRPGVPLDGNAVFEIGSITKAFTASVLAGMVARGEVRLDDAVDKYLPRAVVMPSRGGKQITLAHLATHTSGLPGLPSNLQVRDSTNPYAAYTVERMYQFLTGYTLARDIGAEYEYSNLGMGLLGHALARRAGKSYEALLIERVLAPLDLDATRIAPTQAMRARFVKGHNPQGEPVPYWGHSDARRCRRSALHGQRHARVSEGKPRLDGRPAAPGPGRHSRASAQDGKPEPFRRPGLAHPGRRGDADRLAQWRDRRFPVVHRPRRGTEGGRNRARQQRRGR